MSSISECRFLGLSWSHILEASETKRLGETKRDYGLLSSDELKLKESVGIRKRIQKNLAKEWSRLLTNLKTFIFDQHR